MYVVSTCTCIIVQIFKVYLLRDSTKKHSWHAICFCQYNPVKRTRHYQLTLNYLVYYTLIIISVHTDDVNIRIILTDALFRNQLRDNGHIVFLPPPNFFLLLLYISVASEWLDHHKPQDICVPVSSDNLLKEAL